MLILYLLIFSTTIFLVFYGNLNLFIGISLFLLSTIAISLNLAKAINLNIRLNRLRKKLKAKWVGELSYIDGLNLIPHQNIYLALTRRDSLLFVSEQKEVSIDLENIENVLISKGKNIHTLSSGKMNNHLNLNTDSIAFNNACNLLKTNSYLARKNVLLLSLNSNHYENHKNVYNQELIVLVLLQGKRNLKQFVKRPEIRSKIRYYNKQLEAAYLQKI